MIKSAKKHFVFAMDSQWSITDIWSQDQVDMGLILPTHVSRLVAPEKLPRLLDFMQLLKKDKAVANYELELVNHHGEAMDMMMGGLVMGNCFLIAASAGDTMQNSYFPVRNETRDEILNPLKETLLTEKYGSQNEQTILNQPDSLDDLNNYATFTDLNNEVINMQRELARKNATISELLERKEKLNQELAVANAVKNRIFSIIGHDLRTPLVNIISSIDLIVSETVPYELMLKNMMFPLLRDEVSESLTLLGNLLEWSKSQSGESHHSPRQILLHTVFDPIFSQLRRVALNKKIALLDELQDNTILYADTRILDVVLRNLISNAIKFTRQGGCIQIKEAVEDGFVRVFVLDNGVGMTPEKILTLFDFSQNPTVPGTDGEKGTGFGLMLCKSLVQQNGGELHVEARNGGGMIFSFTVPLAP